MKILSKYKDYFDYLVGIYGMDEKLILDRTKFHKQPYTPANNTKITFYICDKVIECLYKDDKYWYGEEIKQFCEKHQFWDGVIRWYLKDDSHIRFYLNDYPTDLNDKHECPILIKNYGSIEKFPILKEYDFASNFPAEQMWIDISNWLSKPKPVINNMTNKEKIVSHGFDLKESFRPNKK